MKVVVDVQHVNVNHICSRHVYVAACYIGDNTNEVPTLISSFTEFFLFIGNCRGIDFAVVHYEVPSRVQELPSLLNQVNFDKVLFLRVLPEELICTIILFFWVTNR